MKNEEKRMINVNRKSEGSGWFTITDFDGSVIGEAGLLRMLPA